MNDETLVVRASCPLNMYLITPGIAVYIVVISRQGAKEQRRKARNRLRDIQGNNSNFWRTK
ncbi:MAG: hypothetical protein ACKPGB_01755 [Dolichospermum sp.]